MAFKGRFGWERKRTRLLVFGKENVVIRNASFLNEEAGIFIKKMYDSFNRKIDYLRISVTDRCNLRCIYCMPEGGILPLTHDDILRYEEIAAIIRASVELGIDKFRITGGEPLVRKGLVEFIEGLKDIVGINDLSITTNGVKLKEYAKPLYEAGLKRINISLDTLDDNKFNRIARQGKLRDVLDGIEEALRVGFSPIKINVVLIRGINDDEILDFARLSLDRPLDVRFIELMPIGESKLLGREKIVPIEEIKLRCQTQGRLELIDITDGNGPAEYYRINGWQGRIGFIGAITNPFCEGCNRLRLTADGILKPCLSSENGVDLTSALRPMVDNNKIEELIKEAVNSKPKGHNMAQNEFENHLCSMSRIGG